MGTKDPPSVCFDLLTLALRSTTNPTEDFVTAPGWTPQKTQCHLGVNDFIDIKQEPLTQLELL